MHFGSKTSWMARTVLAIGLTWSASVLAQSNPGPIKIGVLTDLSGPYKDLSGPGTVKAVEMAVADKAPALNLKVEVVSDDTQTKTDIGAEVARRWYDSGVDVIMDVPGTPIALAVQELAAKKDRIVIFGASASDDISGKRCNANTVHYGFNTRALTFGAANSIVASGKSKWYFITADYAFGQAVQGSVTKAVEGGGGQVLGSTKLPLNTMDFSAAILSAQSSGAQVIGLANGGMDLQGSIRQAREFGVTASGQSLVAFAMFLSDVNSLGLDATQGLIFASSFYWDRNDASRAWAHRYFELTGKMPTEVQAAMYSATAHYLDAVAAAGSKDTSAVMKKMKELPINDAFAQNATIREDGLLAHDMLRVKVKTPAESKGPWDYYTVDGVIPADVAFGKAEDSACPLVQKK
jgi:branched-chain amino acid transport system substrate-binding protein